MPYPEGILAASTIISIGYALIAVTSAFAIARIGAHFVAPKKISVEDGMVFLAFASNVAMCSVNIALAPIQDRMILVTLGLADVYPEIVDHGIFVSRCYFSTGLIFYIILWIVKFAFLLLYRKLLAGLPKVYTWVWWGIVALCVAALAACLGIYLSPCKDPRALLDGVCTLSVNHQVFTVYFGFSADTLTNILIMALPIRLTWNLQMPRSKKIGVYLIFLAAVICIIVATVRAVQVTHNIRKDPSSWKASQWLAVWGMVEASTAVVIGFAPAFAALIRAAVIKTSTQTHTYDPHGYHKQPSSRSDAIKRSISMPLNTLTSDARSGSRREVGGMESYHDGASSQENLAPGLKNENIRVTTTVEHTYGYPCR